MSDTTYDDDRLTAMGLLSETYQGLVALMTPQLGEHGLSLTEFEVLLRLGRTPGHRLRMTDLAAQTSLSTSGITRVVDRLERSGLVRRVTCETDRRGYWTVLTDDGEQRLTRTLEGHLDLIESYFTGLLSGDQLSALMDALRVVRDIVRPGAAAGVPEVAVSA